jgi:hypothetical protein
MNVLNLIKNVFLGAYEKMLAGPQNCVQTKNTKLNLFFYDSRNCNTLTLIAKRLFKRPGVAPTDLLRFTGCSQGSDRCLRGYISGMPRVIKMPKVLC